MASDLNKINNPGMLILHDSQGNVRVRLGIWDDLEPPKEKRMQEYTPEGQRQYRALRKAGLRGWKAREMVKLTTGENSVPYGPFDKPKTAREKHLAKLPYYQHGKKF